MQCVRTCKHACVYFPWVHACVCLLNQKPSTPSQWGPKWAHRAWARDQPSGRGWQGSGVRQAGLVGRAGGPSRDRLHRSEWSAPGGCTEKTLLRWCTVCASGCRDDGCFACSHASAKSWLWNVGIWNVYAVDKSWYNYHLKGSPFWHFIIYF